MKQGYERNKECFLVADSLWKVMRSFPIYGASYEVRNTLVNMFAKFLKTDACSRWLLIIFKWWVLLCYDEIYWLIMYDCKV